jgi:hypothetical protein
MSDHYDELAARRHANAPVSRIPSQHEYEAREARMYHAQVAEIEKAPLSERKEAASDFLAAMKHYPDTVAERVGWLIDGNYGKGSYDAARRVLAMGARANKAATLTQMIAQLEWRCPARMAAAAWKKLSPSEKARLDHAVKSMITSGRYEED